METNHQIQYCEQCIKRKFDPKQEIICGLSNAKADFENECNDYENDPTFKKAKINYSNQVNTEEADFIVSEEDLDKLKLQQNLFLGSLAAIIAAIIGAILWAFITVTTEYQIGIMALAIGAFVGFAMRIFGKGIDPIFGFIGAGIALFGVLLGNLLGIIGFVAQYEGIEFLEVLSMIDSENIISIMQESFTFMDILFYGLAIYEGYRFSFRSITAADIDNP